MYKYGNVGSMGWIGTNTTTVPGLKGKTESEIMEHLHRKHPGKKIVILFVKWK